LVRIAVSGQAKCQGPDHASRSSRWAAASFGPEHGRRARQLRSDHPNGS
jgi:hypothetical protein